MRGISSEDEHFISPVFKCRFRQGRVSLCVLFVLRVFKTSDFCWDTKQWHLKQRAEASPRWCFIQCSRAEHMTTPTQRHGGGVQGAITVMSHVWFSGVCVYVCVLLPVATHNRQLVPTTSPQSFKPRWMNWKQMIILLRETTGHKTEKGGKKRKGTRHDSFYNTSGRTFKSVTSKTSTRGARR